MIEAVPTEAMLASSAGASQCARSLAVENPIVRGEPRTRADNLAAENLAADKLAKERVSVGKTTIRERARQSNITLTTALSLS